VTAGATLPSRLAGVLDGRDLAAKRGLTFLLATTSTDGWPAIAMLSVGEVVADGDAGLRLALHQGTGSELALRASGRATLLTVIEGEVHTLRLRCAPLGTWEADGLRRAAYAAEIELVRAHAVPYATVTSGIVFELTDPLVPARWEDAIDTLRRLEPPPST